MRICFFGDSFTNGTGDDHCLGWVGRICADARSQGCDLTSCNLGIRRDTSSNILTRWKSEAHARLPDRSNPRLVFAFGNNDAAGADEGGAPRVTPSTTRANANEILSNARAWTPTLMIGPIPQTGSPALTERVLRLSTELKELCHGLDVPFLDLALAPDAVWAAWRAEASAGEGVHPNKTGYGALAHFIGAWPARRSWLAGK